MSAQETWEITGAILVAVGGGGAIVAVLSGWLGKVWADRMMATERAKHDQALAELRSKLEQANQERLTELKTRFDIFRDTYLKEHNDKLASYRLATDIISEYLAEITSFRTGVPFNAEAFRRFNQGRLRAHGYLAMLAPQDVMDAYDKLIDGIFTILEKSPPSFTHDDWKQVRSRAYDLINTIRADVGIGKGPVSYHGHR